MSSQNLAVRVPKFIALLMLLAAIFARLSNNDQWDVAAMMAGVFNIVGSLSQR